MVNRKFQLLFGIFAASLFLISQVWGVSAENPPGVLADPDSLLDVEAVGLAPIIMESGNISWSIDGLGIVTSSGIIQVEKPSGATVRSAYLAAATTGGSEATLDDGDITIDDQPVNWERETYSYIGSNNYWANVTDIVKPIVDSADAGRIDLTIEEIASEDVDGSILVVIFDDNSQPSSNVITLFWGTQDVNGDYFYTDLAEAVDLSDSNFALDLSLGFSHSYQGSDQYTQVSINGSTSLSGAAGGYDDGEAENGALLTVGGLDDQNDNPSDSAQGPNDDHRADDGLYDLTPFVNNGTQSIDVSTINPSQDDNLFFAALFHGGATAPPEPTPPQPTPPEKICGPMDVVFVLDNSGSMGSVIGNVKSEITTLLNDIDAASQGDYQMGFVTFRDDLVVRNDLAAGNRASIETNISNLFTQGSIGLPEASDEALNTVINGLDESDRSQQAGDFDGVWRSDAVKIVILITDAPPGGFDFQYTVGIDDVNAHNRAVEAAAQDILISAIFVPTAGDYSGQVAIMQDYATTTGGIYVETLANGNGTADAIAEIIDSCGTEAVDLSISKSNGQESVTAGEALNYTITINNTSPTEATNVVVTDTLPLHTTFNSASDGGSESSGIVTWNVGTLAGGESKTLSLSATLTNPVPAGVDMITNTVRIGDDGANGDDPTPENNIATDIDEIEGLPDLIIPLIDRSGVTTTLNDPPTVSGNMVVQVKNQDTQNVSDPFKVTLFEDLDGDLIFTVGTDNVLGESTHSAGLASDDTISLSIPVSGETLFRDNTIHAFVDSDEVISESNEENNYNQTGAFCTSPPEGKTNTLDVDFDEGFLVNVNHDSPNNDQLQLDSPLTTFPFIWIALSSRGTIVKVHTETGEILGEYLSSPDGRAHNPSRTTVDLDGNVWTGNRDEGSGGKGSIVHIGLDENAQCIDRNGNGVIDTSSGLGDIKDWSNTGNADSNGGVSTAEDECIIHYVRTNGTAVRTVAVDADNNVWAGGYGNRVHDLIDGLTGDILKTISPACGGYGGMIDRDGILWSAIIREDQLLRYDPATDTEQCISLPRSYGLAVDGEGNIWNSQYDEHKITKFSPDGTALGTFSAGGNQTKGIAVTADDNVWLANTGSNTVTRLDKDGNLLATISVPSGPTGVAVDAAEKVWITNRTANNAVRIDPASNTIDLTVDLGAGAGPYNYSDMTGIIAMRVTSPKGTWTSIHDAGKTNTPWGRIVWNSDEPTGTSITVRVRSADTEAWLGDQPYVEVENGVNFEIPNGRFLQFQVTLRPNKDGDSPILYDLSVEPAGNAVLADLTAQITELDETTIPGSVIVKTRVGNGGGSAVAARVPVAIYDGNPASGGTLIGMTETSNPMAPGEYEEVSFTWNSPPEGSHNIYVVVDDNGEGEDRYIECDETNNSDSKSYSIDVEVCEVDFNARLEWEWTGNATLPDSNQVMMSPAVLDINNDNVPDIIFSSFAGEEYNQDGHLRAIDGRTGDEIFTVTDETYDVRPAGSVAVGDIDSDGQPEIIATHEDGAKIMAFEHDGTFKWISSNTRGALHAGGASIADLDHDGNPEIVIGSTVFNNDGTERFKGTAGRGDNAAGPLSIVANLDMSGDDEVIAGNTAYRSDGSIYWERSDLPDGFAAVGNFDGDAFPEIVLISRRFATPSYDKPQLTLLEHDGTIIWQVELSRTQHGGAPVVADMDGDGELEIGISGSDRYFVYETDGTLKWQTPTKDDNSNLTGSSAFDFDKNGAAEVIHSDEKMLRIFDGTTGAVLWEVESPSGTTYELPVIVDVDADEQAEIVMVSSNYLTPGSHGIQIYGHPTWPGTRGIWNQHSYHITNINDDGTIPTNENANWSTHNTYRVNLPTTGCPQAPLCEAVDFHVQLDWEWTGGDTLPDSNQVMMAPVVMDINEDNIPDIIFASFAGTNYNTGGHLRAISGSDGSELFTVTNPDYAVRPAGSIAVGDIDGDKKPEIITVYEDNGKMIAFEHDGTFKWKSTNTRGALHAGGASIADIDRDGTPEIVIGSTVFNNDGTERFKGMAGRGNNLAGPLSVVANLDMSGDQEIVAGNTAYRSDGSIYWEISDLLDGFPAIGNFDNDMYPEIVLMSHRDIPNGHPMPLLTLLQHDGTIIWQKEVDRTAQGGAPVLADVDGDGQLEIGISGSSRYFVFEGNGALKWQSATVDGNSNVTGSSAFDFDGDGEAEIVHSDEEMLRIFNGNDGSILWETESSSGTTHELPIIVDVDADDKAELIMVSNNYLTPGSGSYGIQVYSHDKWPDTRQIWNQHSYHVTNVNDDGTIPQSETGSWRTLNAYRLNPSAVCKRETKLTIDPPLDTVTVSNTFTIEVQVQHVEDLRAASFALEFNEDVLEVVDSNTGISGLQIEPGSCPTPDTVITNSADNTTGVIEYASTSISSSCTANPDGVIARIQFHAHAPGKGLISFTSWNLSNSLGATIVVEDTQDGSIIAEGEETGNLEASAGGVRIIGREMHWDTKDPYYDGAVVNVIDADDNIIATTTTNEDGSYLISDIPVGTYTVRIEEEFYLYTEQENVEIVSDTTTTLADVVLWPGDTNGDNDVNILDLTPLFELLDNGASLADGIQCTTPYNPNASWDPALDTSQVEMDFNLDCKVDVGDIALHSTTIGAFFAGNGSSAPVGVNVPIVPLSPGSSALAPTPWE